MLFLKLIGVHTSQKGNCFKSWRDVTASQNVSPALKDSSPLWILVMRILIILILSGLRVCQSFSLRTFFPEEVFPEKFNWLACDGKTYYTVIVAWYLFVVFSFVSPTIIRMWRRWMRADSTTFGYTLLTFITIIRLVIWGKTLLSGLN